MGVGVGGTNISADLSCSGVKISVGGMSVSCCRITNPF